VGLLVLLDPGHSPPSNAGMAAAATQGAVSGSSTPLADPSSANECGIVWGSNVEEDFTTFFFAGVF
jgi:hypothetical protein